jgi:putative transposase
MISLKYRIYPNKEQETKLLATLTTCRYTYNNALAERIDKYKTDKISVSYVDQANHLSNNKNEYQVSVHSQVLQDTLKRLDKSFKRFFDGLKKGVRVGFPRFKAENRFRSFCYPQSGFRVINEGTHIRLSKIGDIKIRLNRPIEGKVKTCIIIRDVDQWFVVLTCEQLEKEPTSSNKPSIGIDVGIEKLATMSDGSIIQNPRTLVKAQDKLAQQQRWLSRKKKGSKNKTKQRIKVAKLHRKIRRQRDDFLHKVSAHLATNYSTIAFEKLNIRGMLKNHCLAKHISDASWNKLIQLTTYKAESAGGCVVKVDAKYTSQNCSGCGERVSKTLAERTHCCPRCGLVMDRDENAAVNILNRVGSTQINAQGDNVRPTTNPNWKSDRQLSLN